MTRLGFGPIVLSCLAFAGCGGGDSPSATATPSATSSTSSSAAGAPAASSLTTSVKAQTISGTISGGGGATVTLAGTATSTVADSAGNYQLSAADNSSYTIVPSKTGYVFVPASLAATVSGSSASDEDFLASSSTAATYTLSGTVTGVVATGVTVTLNGSNVGAVMTDSSGNYTISGLVSGTYTVSASLSGYAFSPALIVALGSVDSTGNNFTDSASGTTALAFSTVSPLPTATAGTAYTNTVIASISGGTAPYHYQTDSLAAGIPPLGMVLNPNGNLTGTAQTGGTYRFGVCVVDAAGNTIQPCDTTSVTVVAPATTTTPTTPSPTPPTVSLTASPPTIAAGASSMLIWSTSNATACTGSGGSGAAWSGALVTAGQLDVSPTTTTAYSLTCTGSGGSASASVKITVSASSAPGPSVTLSANPTTITAGSNSTLSWSSSNASSCTANGAWSGNQATSGSMSVSPTTTSSYTLTCQNASGASAHASQSITVNAATAQTQAASGTSWVYYNGQFDWPGTYSYNVSLNYNDTSGAPLSGGADIQVNLTGQWGGWQPYAQNWDFNSAPYTKLTFSLKPTVANQQWSVYFMKVGDIPVGNVVNVLNYGPAPVVGQWATYTIPLSDIGVQGLGIYKFCIHDETGLYTNTWYVDNVGFVP